VAITRNPGKHLKAHRKRARRRLSEGEEHYRTMVEMAPDAVIVHQNGRFVYANCAALGIYGARSLEELQRHGVLDLVHPEERGTVAGRVQRLMSGEEIPLREFRLLRLDGQTISVEASSTLIDYYGMLSIQSIARDITVRKRIEAEREEMIRELDHQRARFETVLRQMPVGVMIAEAATGKVILENDQSRSIHPGLPPMQKMSDYGQLRMFRLDGAPLRFEECPMVRALKGETVTGEEIMVGTDAEPAVISVNAIPIRDAAGSIVSGLVAFNDVTESKNAAKALAASEQRLQLALDAAEMGSCEMDVGSGRGIWSRRHFQLLGYPLPAGSEAPADIGMWQSLVHPDDRGVVFAALDRAKESGRVFRSEHRVSRADNGQLIWVSVQGRFLCDGANDACRFIGMISDVTERKAREEGLRHSELRYRLMADSMPQMVWSAEPDGSLDYVNMVFELYTGIDRESLQLDRQRLRPEELMSRVVHPEDVAHTLSAWRGALASGGVYRSECRLRRVDGVYHWHLGRAIPERNERGEVVKWYGTATDIDDLRETQEKLRHSEAKFRWLYESNMIAVFFWKKDGTVTEANAAFCELAGFSREECRLGGLNWLEISAPEYSAADRAAVAEIVERGICRPYEKELVNHHDGHRVPVLITGARMPDSEIDGIGFAIDLTELKLAEHALREEANERLRAVGELAAREQLLIRQGRLAAMGEMIANIAHQWRQPLNTLGLIVQELPRYYERNLFSKEYLDDSVSRAMQVLNYMSRTIDGFRNFFGPDKEKEKFRVGEVVAKTVSIVEAAFNELRLKIEVDADGQPVVFGYPNEFSQVVMNILVNAKDAVLERKVPEPRVVVRLFTEGEKTVVTIADNAGGIPPEIIQKVFDPYFTTKGPEQGTGIGLFMSKTIIEKNMGGSLTVRNTQEGAEFRIEV